MTAAYNVFSWDFPSGDEFEGLSYLAQAGCLFPGTAWEIAARYAYYETVEVGVGATEIAFAVTYHIDGHADKVTLDVALLSGEDDISVLADTYAGFLPAYDSDSILVRFQWQLAL